jgi:tetratricopeptide (TPR) repeat protein
MPSRGETSLREAIAQAQKFEDKGMVDAAIGWYDRALALKPDDISILSSLGLLLIKHKKFARAREVFKKICINKDYEPDKSIFYLAYSEDCLGRQNSAERYYKQYLRYFPEDVVAMNNLAVVLKKLGLFTEAENILEQILAKDMYNRGANLNLAIIYRKTQRYSAAKAMIEKLLALDSTDTKLRIFIEEMKEEEARFKHDREDIFYYNALTQLNDKAYKNALEELNKGLRLNPRSNKIMVAFGQVYEEMGDLEVAFRSYERSLSTASGNMPVYERLLYLADKLGKKDSLKKFLRNIVYDLGDTGKYFDMYISMLVREKNYDEIEKWAMTRPENEYNALAWQGFAHCGQGSMTEGLSVLDYMYEHINDVNALYRVAKWYREAGNLKRSEEIFKHIIKKWPREIKAYQRLAAIYRRLDRNELADDLLRKVYRMQKQDGAL